MKTGSYCYEGIMQDFVLIPKFKEHEFHSQLTLFHLIASDRSGGLAEWWWGKVWIGDVLPRLKQIRVCMCVCARINSGLSLSTATRRECGGRTSWMMAKTSLPQTRSAANLTVQALICGNAPALLSTTHNSRKKQT